MNNLRRFQTEEEYTAATLNYPAVSWIVSGDTVHFDKPAPVNNKIMAVGVPKENSENSLNLYNLFGTSPSTYFYSISVDDVAIDPITAQISFTLVEGVPYVIKYEITTTTIGDCFATNLGDNGSETPNIEFLIPAQITSVGYMPTNILKNLVVEATTPPDIDAVACDLQFDENSKIYVPSSSVDTYKAANGWSTFANKIEPISNYQGNLPI